MIYFFLLTWKERVECWWRIAFRHPAQRSESSLSINSPRKGSTSQKRNHLFQKVTTSAWLFVCYEKIPSELVTVRQPLCYCMTPSQREVSHLHQCGSSISHSFLPSWTPLLDTIPWLCSSISNTYSPTFNIGLFIFF